MRFIFITLAFVLCLNLSIGCRTVGEIDAKLKFPSGKKVKHKGHGPPPHAPAHGYRHKHKHGLELEYDSGLGVYFAVNMPDVYFYNGLYMKISGGLWSVATEIDGHWRRSDEDEVPVKLVKEKRKKKSKKKGHKGKGHGKKKKKKK